MFYSIREEKRGEQVVLKRCGAVGDGLSVEILPNKEAAIERAIQLVQSEGCEVLLQPDYSKEVSFGESKWLVRVGSNRDQDSTVLGLRHQLPGHKGLG